MWHAPDCIWQPENLSDEPPDGCCDPTARLLRRIRDSLPAHYFDCDRFEVYNYGTRQGTCDCTATADFEALLALTNESLPATANDVEGDAQ